MKLLTSLAAFVLLLFTATCNNSQSNSTEQYSGVIEQQGITSYQYGTHTLTSEATFYALTSETVDLDQYLNQEVSLKAEKVEGYPVDGGPVYLRVLEVNEAE